MSMPRDIDIAHKAKLRRIVELAEERLGIPEEYLESYGRYKAKLSLAYIDGLRSRPNGKLILVSAISPTPAGEGKTTTTVGLADGLNRIGKKAIICLREPSLGPVFGMKGGAAGGGYAQVVPMEDINLHFTGDFNAIALANNLLAALIDNHIHHGNELGFDVRRITWKRVVDMNDRALRDVTVSLGGPANGYPRQDGFDIVVASEIMAIFCLATSLQDLKTRMGKIVVGYTREQKSVLASDLKAHGAMTALLKDAIKPNLVQTLENNPAFIHGGPFANIAHGCNSVIATQTALKLGEYVVTEAGFGDDVLAELQRRLRRDHRVAAVRDVREGSAVNECGVVLQGLHEVGLDRVLQECGHCAVRLQITSQHRFLLARVADDDLAHARLQVLETRGQAEDRHDLRSDDDIEPILARITVRRPTKRDRDVAQCAVVHVDDTLPRDAAHVEAELVAMMDVVVDQRGEQVVGERDSIEVTGEMQVDVLHRHYLRVAAAGGAALHAEYRAKRGLAQADDRFLPDAV